MRMRWSAWMNRVSRNRRRRLVKPTTNPNTRAIVVAGALAFAIGLPAAQKPPDARAMRVQLLHPGLGLYVFLGGGGANTVVLAVRLKVQGPVPVQPPPVQPSNVALAAGVAVRVTTVPLS